MVYIIDHPLIKHKLTIMRKKETCSKDFRENLDEIASLMAYEVTKNVSLREINITTPICDTIGYEVKDDILNFDLASYIAKDWIMLFLIPYVCYKYSVRDGDTGLLFSEEFSQGFQQLQNSFSVPSTVILNEVVGEPAYSQVVLENLETLNKIVTTRAILEKYKTKRYLNAVYDDFYNHGGWGV